MTDPRPQAMVPNLCETHLALLVHGAGWEMSDPWYALCVAAQVALFQAATCDPQTAARTGGDVTRIREIGCLGCYKPDAFGEIVEVAKGKDLGAIKRLGEQWVRQAASQGGGQ